MFEVAKISPLLFFLRCVCILMNFKDVNDETIEITDADCETEKCLESIREHRKCVSGGWLKEKNLNFSPDLSTDLNKSISRVTFFIAFLFRSWQCCCDL